MSPTSRNTLMIGGALILIALLLVCGPLSGRFGSGGTDADQAPSVAAGPPADATGSLAAATLGAVAGAVTAPEVADARIEDPCARDLEDDSDVQGYDSALGDSDCPPIGTGANAAGHAANAGQSDADSAVRGAGAAIAAVGVGAGGAVAAGLSAAADGAGSAATATTAGTTAASSVAAVTPPPVSAGVGNTNISGATLAPSAADLAAAMTSAFDNAAASASGVLAAGPVVKRFPPPVASPGGTSLTNGAPPPFGPGNILLPCDSPGSGCRNVAMGSTMPPTNPTAGSGPPPPFPVRVE